MPLVFRFKAGDLVTIKKHNRDFPVFNQVNGRHVKVLQVIPAMEKFPYKVTGVALALSEDELVPTEEADKDKTDHSVVGFPAIAHTQPKEKIDFMAILSGK